MENFKKLSRAEMKNVKGGHTVPLPCTVGSACTGSSGGNLTSGTCSATCECSEGNDGQRNDCSNL